MQKTLVISCITILNAEIKRMQLHVDVWKNQLLLDQLPDYSETANNHNCAHNLSCEKVHIYFKH